MRILMLLVVACWLAGCAKDVVMVNPVTGERRTCRASSLDPWSQQKACVGDHTAHGWRRLDAESRQAR